MKPEVSIIVPVYNVEDYLEKCIESILSQTLTCFEVILVNDGSTDKSGLVCKEYEKKDNRVKVIQKENGGLSSARNAGMKIARGKYIGFVDSDDYIDPNMYKNLIELCEKTNGDIGICKFGREINGKKVTELQKKIIIEFDNLEAMRELFKGELYRFSVCNKIFKKSCFENILFPDGRIHEDLSTSYKVFSNAKKVVYSSEIGYMYVKREGSILTSKFNEKRLDAFLGWKEIIPFMTQHYPELSKEYFSCFAFGCLDNVYYILNEVMEYKKRNRYLLVIQQIVKTYYKKIISNDLLSLKDKLIITLLNYNVLSLYSFYNTKEMIKKLRIK
ncbi:glycosyltransferase [Lederbergia citri]|uniref:Glycosyltransferase n=1 Tax=Lederbergia citri TaxID=2833580 RepID=A0A942TID0_9BACI|nr:glycosyltransferase [Lederbergia citri]MBS4197578.1 glycosyltransferase [Lederbergia citri]